MLRLLFSGFIQEIVLRFSSDRQKETCAEQFRMMQRIIFKEQMFQITTTTTPLSHCFVKVWCYFPTVVLRQWVIDLHPDTWPIKLVWPWTLFPHLLKTLQTLLHSLWGLLQINWSSIISSVMHFPSSSSFPVSNIISTHGMHMWQCSAQRKLFEIDKTVCKTFTACRWSD